jgi:protein ImuB
MPSGDVLDDNKPALVVAKLNNAMTIAALNDAAAHLGLERGLPLANARAVCPDIQVFDADEAADAKLLGAVADWCDRFTPLVALDGADGLFLDISGCTHLFGGEAKMLRTICTALTQQGFVVNAAIAGTPACARALAMSVKTCIVPEGEEAFAVAPLPVFTLGAADEITRGLRRAGLKTIGDVAARAPHEITARFGAGFTALLQQALGYDDAPISPRKPVPDYVVERLFAEPVATDAVISSVLSALARTLGAAMERHGKGARRLEASFFRTDGAVRSITVESGLPVTRVEAVERLFRERLDVLADPLDPGFGFDLIRLSAGRVELVVQEQRDFDSRVQDSGEVSDLLDRIAARIGKQRVLVYLPVDTHIPERSEIAVPAQQALTASSQAVWPARFEAEPPLRPLRLFERPEQIEVNLAKVPDGAPPRFTWRRSTHAVVRAEGPERVAMEWWKEGSQLTRDYFRIEDDRGLRFWIYRDGLYEGEIPPDETGKPVPPKWYVHGVFA